MYFLFINYIDIQLYRLVLPIPIELKHTIPEAPFHTTLQRDLNENLEFKTIWLFELIPHLLFSP